MRQSTRLILNTSSTFARMLVSVGISLLTTRLLLGMLGETDLGIFGLVWAAISTVSIVSESLLNSTVTRLAMEIGRRDDQRLRRVMATSVVIFAAIAALMMLISLLFGGPVLGLLNIPSGRLHDAWLAL